MTSILLSSVLLSTILLFSLFFVVAKIMDDYSIIDTCWGLSFINQVLTLAALLGHYGKELSMAHFLMVTLVTFWGVRLSGYLFLRLLSKGEDSRYSQWREDFKPNVTLNFYVRVYLLQAILSLVVGSGLILTFIRTDLEVTKWSLLGLTLSLFGFLYEAIADFQKSRFKKKEQNKGRPCREGLWYFSRHPNYFGEMIFWWGLYFFSIGTAAMAFAWIGPLSICFFLIKVSGVPMLTEEYKKKPLYKEYLETTNTFLPWFPKQSENL